MFYKNNIKIIFKGNEFSNYIYIKKAYDIISFILFHLQCLSGLMSIY